MKKSHYEVPTSELLVVRFEENIMSVTGNLSTKLGSNGQAGIIEDEGTESSGGIFNF